MIQDIKPDQLKNEYRIKQPVSADYVMLFSKGCIYVKYENEQMSLPKYEQVREQLTQEARDSFIYLFSIDSHNFFYLKTSQNADVSIGEELSLQKATPFTLPDFSFQRMFSIRKKKPQKLVFATATAYHLHMWYDANRFCGRCGKPLVQDEKVRMLRCEHCGNMVFPKIAPAVIVGVTKGNQILMTKYQGREYKKYALIAGFTEIGETAEQTVQREVKEEVGLDVTNITYYKSQPWGFDSNLLLGFFAELKEDNEILLDREELALAEWVSYEDIPEDEEKLSLTAEMMQHFKKSKMLEK